MINNTLETKDEDTEILSQYDEASFDEIEESVEDKRITHSIFRKLEEICCKFDGFDSRIDKIENSYNQINLKEYPESIECKSLREYISTGKLTELESKNGSPNNTIAYTLPRKIQLHVDKLLLQSSVMRKLCSVETISCDSIDYLTTNNKETFVGWVGKNYDSEDNKESLSNSTGKSSGSQNPPDDTKKDPANNTKKSSSTIKDVTEAPKLNTVTIKLFELYAQPQIAKKLLEDSPIDLAGWLINNLVDAFSRMENKAFISGTGIMEPLGILGYAEGSSYGQISHIKAKTLDADAIIKLVYSLDEYFASRAVFLMHRSVLQHIRSLKTSSGQYLLQHGSSGDELLMGIPVHQTSDMPLLDSKYPVVALGDFKNAYKVLENREMRILRDPYTNKSFVKFYTTKRVGGGLINSNAIKLLKIEP